MTIDPDDYDLRELRRIADERRSRSDDTDEDESRSRSDGRRQRSNGRDSFDRPDREERRRSNGSRRNGHRRGDRANRGRDASRGNGTADRQRNGRGDGERRNDTGGDVSVRPRENVTPPRRGGSDHADGHDEVVQADRIARDLGFGRGDDSRDGRPDRGRRDRSRSDRRDRGRSDGLSRPRAGGFDHPDDVGRFQFDTEIRERPRGRAGEALRQNQLEQLLVHETAAADRLSKPYLSSLPDAYAAERIVFDWLEFLVLKGGFKRTMDAIRYYHTVEWITDDVEAELQDYLVGFSGEVTNTSEFDVDDHHLSLVYIARLASME